MHEAHDGAVHGRGEIARYLDEMAGLAVGFARRVASIPELELATEPDRNIVCFRRRRMRCRIRS